MEVSDCSPVPYSLADIQLPESPKSHMKPNDAICEERNQTDHISDELDNENSLSDNKNKSNGETPHKLTSQEDMSESETKDSSYSNDSPEKSKTTKSKRHSDESSDAESDKNGSPYKKKSFKYEDTSSNLAADSDDCPKDTLSKEQKNIKPRRNTDESDNEKSSDYEKYNHHVDSKRKSHDKHRKRSNRRSSSSTSRSSDSSAERRHSKKPVATKNKDFVKAEERNQMSDKSSDEKPIKHKKNDSATESSEVPSVSVKKHLKLKRDNVPIEIPSPVKESLESSASNKSVEKKSSSHSASDKPIKQESLEKKEEKFEINYKSRKVLLSNRKLNRKSSEENNIEPKLKKSKWESFSSVQKSPYTVNISIGALKNWFPDFKLVTETSMEVEQDEHSLSATDLRNDDLPQADVLNENESNIKQDSTSQMDMDDSVSQEPNYDKTDEIGLVSKIVFIQNLVRPFTLNQLKELLKQNGKIVEEYFWIDKIKSKCFVMYETEKEAIKARNALNNARWPSSNPKILSVEFSSVEELEKHKKGNEPQPLKVPEPPVIESSDTLETRVSHTVEEHKRKDRERRKEKDRAKLQAPVREWDKDKIIQDSPEREQRPLKEEKSKSAEKKEKKDSKKRTSEDTPAKLLDDLFQKTKSVPCIYWLPLTEEQAKTKEEEKKMRRLEREKRNQQLREQEEAERRSRRARSSSRRREKENRKSSTRSRSPASRRR